MISLFAFETVLIGMVVIMAAIVTRTLVAYRMVHRLQIRNSANMVGIRFGIVHLVGFVLVGIGAYNANPGLLAWIVGWEALGVFASVAGGLEVSWLVRAYSEKSP